MRRLTLLAAWGLCASAWAQDVAAPTADEGGSLGWLLFRTLIVLGFVVVVAYVVLNMGLRRLMGLPAVVGARRNLIRVLERAPIEPKRALYVVEAAGEFFLVGSAETGLNLISKLDAAAVTSAQAAPPLGGASPIRFLDRLRAAKPPPSDSGGGTSAT